VQHCPCSVHDYPYYAYAPGTQQSARGRTIGMYNASLHLGLFSSLTLFPQKPRPYLP
jgi:hypothetical protein